MMIIMAHETGTLTFTYSGSITDEHGVPVSGAEVIATYRDSDSLGYIDTIRSDSQGHFTIDRVRALSGARYDAAMAGKQICLEFRHSGYGFVTLEDLQTRSHDELTHLQVTLYKGRSVKGQVVNPEQQPVSGASVEMTFGDDYTQRRGTLTDVHGRFALHGLPNQAGTLQVLTVDPSQPALTGRREMNATDADAGTLVMTPITFPPTATVHEFLGMQLVDVDASVQDAFHLSGPMGVLVLDPGSRSHGLELQRGDHFMIVGNQRVSNFADFREKLLGFRLSPPIDLPRDVAFGERVRVVWAFRRPDLSGANTQYLSLSAGDLEALSA